MLAHTMICLVADGAHSVLCFFAAETHTVIRLLAVDVYIRTIKNSVKFSVILLFKT